MKTSDKIEWVICSNNYPNNIYSAPSDTKQQAIYKADQFVAKGTFTSYEIMTFDEFFKRKAERLLTPIAETTEENYYDHLECLPPMNWGINKGVNSFFMSEFTDGNYTQQYAKKNDKYYSKTVNYFDKETWITNEEINACT